MKIRKAKKEDLKEISKIFNVEASKKPYNQKFTEKTALEEIIKFFKEEEIYVVVIQKIIVGFIVSHINKDDKKKAYIQELWLRSDYQGKNIGKTLIDFIEKNYKNKGVKSVRLVSNKKSKAFGFYKKLKYKENKNMIFMDKKLR